MPTPAVVCAGLSFAWPDGTPVLDRLDVAFDAGRTGLIGSNGSGKTTLLRLIAGELTPTAGMVSVAGEVAVLPQHLPLDVWRTVSDLLGIRAQRAALAAIVSGDASAGTFAVLADGWDVEERARAELARLGLFRGDPDPLDRPVGTISGGEAVLLGLAGLLLRRAPVTLLDEPTNNLDRLGRALVYDAVEDWPGVLLVVSHDRELLERVDQVADLRDGAIRVFGGRFAAYEQQLAAERETAERRVRAAEGAAKRERRQLSEAHTKLDRRLRTGRTAEQEQRVPKIVAHARRRQAQVSAGKYRILQEQRLAGATAALAAAEEEVRVDERIRVDLPATAVPAGRTVLEVDGLTVRGPERIALLGRNGSGKTTLLRAVVDGALSAVPVGYLPQRLDGLDPARSVLDNVRRAAPAATPHQIRARLARFLVRGDRVEQAAGTLSGGERFRVSLACLLLAEPPPQLLLLDEPTNNLDLVSVEQLVQALRAYRGALIVASHDRPFLARLGIARWWSTDGPAPQEVREP
jgi:ATPase subunit of ABC transporter with duplicated ATPase domains